MKQGKFIGSLLVCLVGGLLFLCAQITIATSTHYTWSPPFTAYEIKFILMKWAGIIMLIIGIACIILFIWQANYSNKHIKEVTPITKKGESVKCANCGLTVTADATVCPRCKTRINDIKQVENIYCSSCGNPVNAGSKFCTKCGSQIAK